MEYSSNLLNILKDMNKKAGSDVIHFGVERKTHPKIPFSSVRANYMTYGGVPMYRAVEFAGPEGSGKTTTAIDICARYQQMPNAKGILYVDHEHTFDEYWATTLGLDCTQILLYQPETESAEDIFDYVKKLIVTNDIGVCVIDSLASLVPKQVIDEDMDKQERGGIAKVLTRVSNTIIPLLKRYETTFIGINQVRDNFDSWVQSYNTPGGKAWKHQCSLRIMFQKGKFVDDKGNELGMNPENPAGNIVKMNIMKIKGVRPDRKLGQYTLNYTTGIDVVMDTVEVALELGLLYKKGGWFYFYDLDTGELVQDKKIQGISNLYAYYEEHEQEFNDLWNKVNDEIIKGDAYNNGTANEEGNTEE